MSYQVLARKWRPQNFKQMVGQEHVLRALMNALDSDRLHHAYLFTGTRGVGKTTIARILAKCLNCDTGVTSTPCGECNSCKEVADGNFLDLIEVDAASRTKVEDTRELLENVQYAPTRARFKVYLIDEVHMLTGHSFNALLKTLEEPPPHVKFLFATTDPQKLPATILSRCLQFNLKRMPVDMISGHLDYLLQQESIQYEASSLRLLARAADGSMRDALSLLDQSIAFSGSQITESSVRDMLGTISHEPLIDLLELVLAGEGATLLSRIDDLSSVTPDFEVATDALIMLLHQLAVQQVVPSSINEEPRVAELAQKITKEEVQLFYQIALQGRRDLPLSPDPRSGFEMLLLRMMSFRPLREGMVIEQSTPTDNESDLDESKKKTVISENQNQAPTSALTEPVIEAPVEKTQIQALSPAEIIAQQISPETAANLTPYKPVIEPPKVDLAKADEPKADQIPPSVSSNNTDNTIPPWEDIPPFLEDGFQETQQAPIQELSQELSQKPIQEQTERPVQESNNAINQTSQAQESISQNSVEAVVDHTAQDGAISEEDNIVSTSNSIEDLILQTDNESYPDDIASQVAEGSYMPAEDSHQQVADSAESASNHVDTTQPWHQIVPQLKLSGRANELIKHCLLESHENGIISLILNKDSEDLLADTTQEEIQSALINLFGSNTRLTLRIGDASFQSNEAETNQNTQFDKSLETPAQRNIRKVYEKQQQAEQNIETDDFVVELKNRFGAQLVPGSVQPKST